MGAKKFPVLLFAPGQGNLPLEYSALIEDVASHGYIVAGILPTSGSGFTVLSSGRVVLEQPARVGLHPGKGFKAQMAAMQASIERSVHLWSADMMFVLDRLQKLNSSAASPLAGHFDFTRVGVFGHSQGGAASLQAAKDDSRVRAAFDLDGMMTMDFARSGVQKPVAVMNSDMIPIQAMARNPLMSYDSVLRAATPGYHLRLAGSVHFFESDYGLLPFLPASAELNAPVHPSSPFRLRMPLVGSIDPARALTITEKYVEAFFGEYLQGKRSPLLNAPSSEYPEITFQKMGR
jgi:predicted dienelactone hydrolase